MIALIAVSILLVAAAIAWRAFDDYRDRLKLRRKWTELAETEARCREERRKQAEHGATPVSGKHWKRAA